MHNKASITSYREYKRFKFDSFSYKHIANDDKIDKIKKENMALAAKQDAAGKELKNLNEITE